MIIPIIQEPNTLLHAKAQPVTIRTPEHKQLMTDMIDTRVKHKGVGLAATQVGAMCRIISLLPKLTGYSIMVNPEIVKSEGMPVIEEEACLSIEQGTCGFKVARYPKITVRFENKAGDAYVELVAEGLAARVIQHEIDHLDGITIADRSVA